MEFISSIRSRNRQAVQVLIVLFISILSRCSPSGTESRKLGFNIKSSAGNGNGTSVSGDGGDSKGDSGQESTQVAGAGLVPLNIDNGLTRCAMVDHQNSYYDVNCYAVIIAASGAEYKATSIAAGVKVSWDLPQRISGAEINTSACKVDPSGLSQSCEITLSRPIATHVQTSMKVAEAVTKRSKTSSDTVVLSISIKVFGMNINAPVSFQVDSNASFSTISQAMPATAKDQLFGYQPLLLDPLKTNFSGLRTNFSGLGSQVAVCGSRAYFTTDNFIFTMDTSIKGAANTWLYAGSPIQSNSENLSHRLSHAFFNIGSIACGKESGDLYVLEKYTNANMQFPRIIEIKESGPIEVINSSRPPGFSGDFGTAGSSGLAVDAKLNEPLSIVTDSKNNLWIADSLNNRIRRIDSKGFITTVAGNGIAADYGDGGLAINASIQKPISLAVGPDDSVYIYNSIYIRKIDPKGLISTIAGNPVEPKVGADLTISKNYHFPQLVMLYGIRTVGGMAVGPDGSVYFGEKYDPARQTTRIAKFTPNGKVVSVTASTGGFSGDGGPAINASVYNPTGMAFTSDGNLVFVDALNDRIRMIEKTGAINTIAGIGNKTFSGDGGPASAALMTNPQGIAIAKDGSVIFSDTYNNRVRKIDPNGVISTVAGDGSTSLAGDGGPAIYAGINQPAGIAISDVDGSIYVTEQNNRIRKISAQGIISTIAGCPLCQTKIYQPFDGSQRATLATLYSPFGLTLQSDGSIVFSDLSYNRIHRIDPNGMITTLPNSTTTSFSGKGVTTTSDGSIIGFDRVTNTIVKRTKVGTLTTIAGQIGSAGMISDGSSATSGHLDTPSYGVALPDGRIYFVETGEGTLNYQGRIRILTPDPAQTPGGYIISTLVGAQTGAACGGGVIQKKIEAGQVEQVMQASLASICLATPAAMAIRDNCSSATDPHVVIAFGQSPSFDIRNAGGSIVVMKQPCLIK